MKDEPSVTEARVLTKTIADAARNLLKLPPELRGPFRCDEQALRRVAALPPRTRAAAALAQPNPGEVAPPAAWANGDDLAQIGGADPSLIRAYGRQSHHYDTPLYTADALTALQSRAEALQAEVDRCHARLEIDHYWKMGDNDDSDLERVEATAEERLTLPDGIAARDETIKLLEAEVDRLKAERDEAQAEIERMIPRFVAYDYLESPAGREMAEDRLAILRQGIQDYLDGNYDHPRAHRPGDCRHGTCYYRECPTCDEEHFTAVLARATLLSGETAS